MDYYVTNAIYEYMEENKTSGFAFAKGNIWLLIYGTSNYEPKIIIAASSVNEKEYNELIFSEHEKEIFQLGEKLAQSSNLPFGIIRFRHDIEKIDSVQCINWSKRKFKNISIDKLNAVFEKHGISTKKSTARKPVNDRTSSAYHNWQRDNLGSDIIVIDIDLLKSDSNGEPSAIYELKRAQTPPFDEWKPFKKDYPNFRLAYNFSKMAGIDFYILFNYRRKKPFFDDISKLKLFSFDPAGEGKTRLLRTITMQEFLAL